MIIIVEAFYTDCDNNFLTGLSPLCKIKQVGDGGVITLSNNTQMTNIGDGQYVAMVDINIFKNYTFLCDAQSGDAKTPYQRSIWNGTNYIVESIPSNWGESVNNLLLKLFKTLETRIDELSNVMIELSSSDSSKEELEALRGYIQHLSEIPHLFLDSLRDIRGDNTEINERIIKMANKKILTPKTEMVNVTTQEVKFDVSQDFKEFKEELSRIMSGTEGRLTKSQEGLIDALAHNLLTRLK